MTQPDLDTLKATYAKTVCDQSQWIHSAKRLLASAQLVGSEATSRWKFWRDSLSKGKSLPNAYEAHHFQAVYLLLVGFAIENLLKGHLLSKGKDSFYEGILKTGRFPQSLDRRHDLVSLARSCGFESTNEELISLQRLAKHSRWIGRYPFPMDYREHFTLSSTNKVPTTGKAWSSKEIETINALVRTFCSKLNIQIDF